MPTGKTVMVLCYWGLNDVLTASTALPHAEILKTIPGVKRIVFVTVERATAVTKTLNPDDAFKNFKWIPLQSKSYRFNLVNKINDFILFPKLLKKIIEAEKISLMVAVGTPAGALALLVNKLVYIPFYIAFYEPHASYMLETGVWSKRDLRYIYQVKWEKKQAQLAKGLITVSEKYRNEIITTLGIAAAKVVAAPNGVQTEKFIFSNAVRLAFRKKIGVTGKATVGIYVGKFGGLYYDQEAFTIYKLCFNIIPDFYLVILSPQEKELILDKVRQHNIDTSKVTVASVAHDDVADFLSAADFAFATIKSYPAARYCSPVKIGEYWANGLPVLLTEGVGDDSDIINQEGGGATFNLNKAGSLELALTKIKAILQDPGHRQAIPDLARKYRSFGRVRKAYEYFLNSTASIK